RRAFSVQSSVGELPDVTSWLLIRAIVKEYSSPRDFTSTDTAGWMRMPFLLAERKANEVEGRLRQILEPPAYNTGSPESELANSGTAYYEHAAITRFVGMYWPEFKNRIAASGLMSVSWERVGKYAATNTKTSARNIKKKVEESSCWYRASVDAVQLGSSTTIDINVISGELLFNGAPIRSLP
ncbi:unnamed protein product, partial [Amoebophrya sp. A120]